MDVSPKAQALFLEGFYRERAQFASHRGDQIRAGGKATKANPYKEDELWWLAHGPAMVQRWIEWRAASDWRIWWTPDKEPAIELELTPTWAGVPVRMFLDRVFVLPTNVLVVADIKSGARSPASDLQLAWYAAGILSVYGVHIQHGTYWDARSGDMSPIKPLARITQPLIEFWVSQFLSAKAAGIYLPHLTNMCRACGVNRFCAAYGGHLADRDPDFVMTQGIGMGEDSWQLTEKTGESS